MVAALYENLIIKEMTASHAKKAITGKGGASKQEVAFFLQTLLGANRNLLNQKEDATDALALALAWGLRSHLESTIASRQGAHSVHSL